MKTHQGRLIFAQLDVVHTETNNFLFLQKLINSTRESFLAFRLLLLILCVFLFGGRSSEDICIEHESDIAVTCLLGVCACVS